MNDLLDARGCGIAAAVSGQAQRRMRGWAAKYPGLYDKPEFDPALYGTLAQAAAFAGPWYGADQPTRPTRPACGRSASTGWSTTRPSPRTRWPG